MGPPDQSVADFQGWVSERLAAHVVRFQWVVRVTGGPAPERSQAFPEIGASFPMTHNRKFSGHCADSVPLPQLAHKKMKF